MKMKIYTNLVPFVLLALRFARETLNASSMKEHVQLYDSHHPYCQAFPINTDSYLECLIESMSATLHHPVGTCKMGPPTDPEAVVDSQLRYRIYYFSSRLSFLSLVCFELVQSASTFKLALSALFIAIFWLYRPVVKILFRYFPSL